MKKQERRRLEDREMKKKENEKRKEKEMALLKTVGSDTHVNSILTK